MDKAALFEEFRLALEARLASLEAEGAQARSGTRVDGDHRPANRGERAAVTSQGYLALALGERSRQVRADLELLARISPDPRSRVTTGALFQVCDEEDVSSWYLVLPGGQGARLGAGRVAVVSPDAPLVKAMAPLSVGDVATVQRGGRQVELELAVVC